MSYRLWREIEILSLKKTRGCKVTSLSWRKRTRYAFLFPVMVLNWNNQLKAIENRSIALSTVLSHNCSAYVNFELNFESVCILQFGQYRTEKSSFKDNCWKMCIFCEEDRQTICDLYSSMYIGSYKMQSMIKKYWKVRFQNMPVKWLE